ncbi:hypothetical protein FACS1894123_07830 [Bacteroidia bacterium]|nr:hypothetical protein FACS1894123_07830 [Bacteroidia bacterium]
MHKILDRVVEGIHKLGVFAKKNGMQIVRLLQDKMKAIAQSMQKKESEFISLELQTDELQPYVI